VYKINKPRYIDCQAGICTEMFACCESLKVIVLVLLYSDDYFVI